jgi:hypothetical protein
MRSAAVLLSKLRSGERASTDPRKPRRRDEAARRRSQRVVRTNRAHAIGATRRRTERPPRRRERPLRRAAVAGFAGMSVH